MALAGGVYLHATPEFYLASNGADMLSARGRCHSFDARADGFVPGEAVAAIVLKPLADALRDGDHVYGIVRASGINQDGTTNGITAPSARSQEALERSVYDGFGVDPAQIGLVEAHGTGTILGDPIEIEALTRAFRAYTPASQFCAIGSIKSNLGHTATAAGITGVVKALLALQHRQLPPSLHFETANPNIDFELSPFVVNTTLRSWEPMRDAAGDALPRLAAVSSFGFSGTNAHVVLQEAPPASRDAVQRPGWLIVLSARTVDELTAQAAQLVAHLDAHPDIDAGDLAFTLLRGRRHFRQRLACVVADVASLRDTLRAWLASGCAPQLYVGRIAEDTVSEQAALKQSGEQWLRECGHLRDATLYVERLNALAGLFVQGYRLDYARLFDDYAFGRLPLPTYPFARARHWAPRGPDGGERRCQGDRTDSRRGAGRGWRPPARVLDTHAAGALVCIGRGGIGVATG
jgi:acyl transferase domain-containing protein